MKSEEENAGSDDDFYDCHEENVSTKRLNPDVSKKQSDQTENNLSEKLEKLSTEDESTEEILTEQEKEEMRIESIKIKEEGNKEFKSQKYSEAETLYTEGLRVCPKCFSKERSVLFSNRAACLSSLNNKSAAIEDCSEAIKLNSQYVRALMRRAQLYEETEKLDEALSDYKSVLEIDSSMDSARKACVRLPGQIDARNEKMKAEMLGSLKDMGNKLLGKFGLSTDNFKMEQNPETGGYNIQFQQSPNK